MRIFIPRAAERGIVLVVKGWCRMSVGDTFEWLQMFVCSAAVKHQVMI